MSRAINKPYAEKWHPETGERLAAMDKRNEPHFDVGRHHWVRVFLSDTSSLKPFPARLGMRFLCSNGHVAFYAVSEKKKGKKLCSKFLDRGQCIQPVEQVFWRSLSKLAMRSFRSGADRKSR